MHQTATMKTSNKLILTAIFLVLISLLVFDYNLKEQYESKSYQDPDNGLVALPFKNFRAVDLNASTAANVKFIQGPFSVKADKYTLDFVQVTQHNGRLQIDASFEHGYMGNSSPYILLISCPKLSEINASAFYTAAKKQVIDTVVREDWNMRQVLIDGFIEDSLTIKQSYGSTIVLNNNHIRVLNALVGINDKSGSKLTILKNNQFDEAKINVFNQSRFLLNGNAIKSLKYRLADSAKIIATGEAQYLLNNSIPK